MAKVRYPKKIVTHDGQVKALFKVHYQMGRGVYRISWKDGDTDRGCLAVVQPDRWEWTEVKYEQGRVVDMVTPGHYTITPQALADCEDDLGEGNLTPTERGM